MWSLSLLACIPSLKPGDTGDTGDTRTPDLEDPGPELPGHDDCLPPGERMTDEVCLAVVEEDGRPAGTSYDRSGVDAPDPDVRIDDPDLAWLTAEVERCTCVCCHRTSYGGPGAYFWDLDFGPVWLDSASGWSLEVFSGLRESENQQLPSEDLARVQEIVGAELDRRDEARRAR
ncbi:MAG TPA: hypothetical protein ENK18_23905 [Deltaproteobacteria bacterium]|nr:hypothetical protein [Deltaproteobacteria bacterium]